MKYTQNSYTIILMNIIYIILSITLSLLLFLLGLLQRGVFSAQIEELKARARNKDPKDPKAAAIFALRSNQGEVLASIILFRAIFAVLTVSSLVLGYGVLVGSICSILVLILTSEIGTSWISVSRSERVAALFAPTMRFWIGRTKSINKWLSKKFNLLAPGILPKLVNEAQLLGMIDTNNLSPHAEVAEAELDLARRALTFGKTLVADVMLPAASLRVLQKDTVLSPIVLDELHQTSLQYFPVSDLNFVGVYVGIVRAKDITDLSVAGKKASVVMSKNVYYVGAHSSIGEVFNASRRTGSSVFIVVDEYEELVGLISIEQVIEKIIGRSNDDFADDDNLRAVALRKAEKLSVARKHNRI